MDPDQTDQGSSCLFQFEVHLIICSRRKKQATILGRRIRAYGPPREKTCRRGCVNNTGADQPAHRGSLVSTSVIRFLESIICKLATGEISIFELVSVAEETGLKIALLETPKTGFVASRPILTTT